MSGLILLQRHDASKPLDSTESMKTRERVEVWREREYVLRKMLSGFEKIGDGQIGLMKLFRMGFRQSCDGASGIKITRPVEFLSCDKQQRTQHVRFNECELDEL